jgi:hypothetical protein
MDAVTLHFVDTSLAWAALLPAAAVVLWNRRGIVIEALLNWGILILAGMILAEFAPDREGFNLDGFWIIAGWIGALWYGSAIYALKIAVVSVCNATSRRFHACRVPPTTSEKSNDWCCCGSQAVRYNAGPLALQSGGRDVAGQARGVRLLPLRSLCTRECSFW